MVKMKKAALGAFGMASLNAFGVGFGDDGMDVQNQVSYDLHVFIQSLLYESLYLSKPNELTYHFIVKFKYQNNILQFRVLLCFS